MGGTGAELETKVRGDAEEGKQRTCFAYEPGRRMQPVTLAIVALRLPRIASAIRKVNPSMVVDRQSGCVAGALIRGTAIMQAVPVAHLALRSKLVSRSSRRDAARQID